MINREPHFCSHCNRTTFWEILGESQRLVCIGDSRLKIIGCGTTAPATKMKRYVGACMTCKRLRRGHRTTDGKYLCLYCWGPLDDAKEVEFGDLTGF